MRIIALQGLGGRGKSTTLGMVYDMVLKAGGVPTNKQPLGGDPKDFSDIVRYKSLNVAFFTMGDFSNALVQAIKNYAKQKCDVLVCSISSSTPKVRANNALNRRGAHRINKTIATPNTAAAQLAANTTDAQTIFALI